MQPDLGPIYNLLGQIGAIASTATVVEEPQTDTLWRLMDSIEIIACKRLDETARLIDFFKPASKDAANG